MTGHPQMSSGFLVQKSFIQHYLQPTRKICRSFCMNRLTRLPPQKQSHYLTQAHAGTCQHQTKPLRVSLSTLLGLVYRVIRTLATIVRNITTFNLDQLINSLVSKTLEPANNEDSLDDICHGGTSNAHGSYVSGQTTLHIAAKKGHTNIVAMLLDRGSNVNDTDIMGRSALHLAAAEDHVGVSRLLINRGASIEIQDAGGRTALHVAAENGHVRTVETFLGHTSLIDVSDTLGRTPLHLAIEQGHEDIVRLLLDSGADPTARVSP